MNVFLAGVRGIRESHDRRFPDKNLPIRYQMANLPIALVLVPEPIAVTDPFKLVFDDGSEERTRTGGRRLQQSSNPDVNLGRVTFVNLLSFIDCLE